MNCDKCGCAYNETLWYHLARGIETHHFCSRICLVEFIAPELSKAVAVKQWVPTEEETERMSQ